MEAHISGMDVQGTQWTFHRHYLQFIWKLFIKQNTEFWYFKTNKQRIQKEEQNLFCDFVLS